MWSIYIIASLLTAGIVIKLVQPLLSKGKWQHENAITRTDRHLAYGLIITVPVAAMGLYLFLGRPDLPGAQRVFDNLGSLHHEHYSLLAQKPMETLITQDPDNIGALMTLGEIHLHQGEFDPAIAFYTRAVAASAEQGDMRHRVIVTTLAETIVNAEQGTVTPQARELFEYALTIYPQSPIARHYLALGQAQAGDVEGALSAWRTLLAESHPRDPWRKMVRKAMIDTRNKQARTP